jgi:hypothetical protein
MRFLGLTFAASAGRLSGLRVGEATLATRPAGRALAVVGALALAGRANAQRERLWAAILSRAPLLAAAQAPELADLEAVVAALGPELAPFEAALARFGRRREYRIRIAWASRAALAAAREAERSRLAERCLRELVGAVEDLIVRPGAEPDLVVDAFALVSPQGGGRLAAALARIEAALPGPARAFGPRPATSFAAIEFAGVDAQALREARDLFDLGPSASPAALKAAFRAQSKLWHPDVGGEAERFARLVAARALLSRGFATLRLRGGEGLAA